MYLEAFQPIQAILRNSTLSPRKKLTKIQELVERVYKLDNLAHELAYERCRKPTLDDHLEAARQLAIKENIKPISINEEKIFALFSDSIGWLIKKIEENEGWDLKKYSGPPNATEKPNVLYRPTSMLYMAPWEISVAIWVLADWIRFYRPRDKNALNLIKKGKKYLQSIQSKSGGLGDSIWIKGMQSSNKKHQGNTLETGIGIIAWRTRCKGLQLSQNDLNAIEKALRYFYNNWNKNDGGWGFKPGLKSDIKSTAIALMCLLRTRNLFLSNFAEDTFRELSTKSLKWILEKQKKDGSWEYSGASRDSNIFGSFYGMFALKLVQRYFSHYYENRKELEDSKILKEQIDKAIWRAIRWYENSYQFLTDDTREGWGWEGRILPSAIENSAAAIIVLLDVGWLSEKSPLVESTLSWLIDKRHPVNYWKANTPLVLGALQRVLMPKMRMCNWSPKIDTKLKSQASE